VAIRAGVRAPPRRLPLDRAPPPGSRRLRPALPLLGHAPWFWRDTNGFLLRLAREQGDIAAFRLGRRRAFLLSHPDHVRQVLVDDADKFRKGGLMQRARRLLGDGLLTSEGERHHAQRRALQPAFCRRQLAAYGAAVPRLAAAAAEEWSDGQVVDVSAAMDDLALAVVTETLLGADAAPLAGDLRVLSARGPLLAVPLGRVLERLGVPPFRAAGLAADRLRSAMLDHVTSAGPAGERDLMSLLRRVGPNGRRMSAELARDEAMTMFLAGHDTTAAALTWTWYLLATHPSVAARLRDELDTVLGDRDPTPEDRSSLAYTGMVFDEALRLYPPIGRIGRRPIRDYAIGGRRLPAGAAVFVSPFVTQRAPRWWPDPERFDPERWTPAAVAGRPHYAAFPFGAGPRSCIGGAMARMIGILAIATIARRWDFHVLPGPAPRIRPILTVKPIGGLRLRAVLAPRFVRCSDLPPCPVVPHGAASPS
jgi:cytochrome P450